MKFFYLLLFMGFYTLSFAQINVSTLVDEFDASGGVKVDAAGNIIVANFGQSLDNSDGTQVWKVSPDGTVSLFANGLLGASGNDFDSQGNLFQSNIAGGTVSKITPEGTVSFFATSGISCNVGIVADSADNLYVCNCCSTSGNTIRKLTPSGTSTLFSSGTLFSCPNGITIDNDNNLYVSNFGNGNIIKITPLGTPSLFAQTGGTSSSSPSNGHIVYSEIEDVLYVASHGTHSIYRLSMTGDLTLLAGTGTRGNQDGEALEATFSRPNGVALSHTGDTLYLNSSIPTTDAGGRPLNPSKLRMITGLLNPTPTKNEIISNFSVKISPNPTSDIVHIQFEKSPGFLSTIKLLTASGQLVKYIHQNGHLAPNEQIEFSFKNEVKGLYYLQFEVGNQSFIRKIIFQ